MTEKKHPQTESTQLGQPAKQHPPKQDSTPEKAPVAEFSLSPEHQRALGSHVNSAVELAKGVGGDNWMSLFNAIVAIIKAIREAKEGSQE